MTSEVDALPRPITIAHRFGNHTRLIAQAHDAGVDMVEADVWMHHGRLEVRHDKTLWPLPLFYDKWKLKPAWGPRFSLSAMLDVVPEGMGMMLDLKGHNGALPAALIDALDHAKHHHPTLISARFWSFLPSLAEREDLTLFHSVGNEDQLRRVRPLLDERENDAISIHYRLLNAETVRSLKGQVALIATWPINDDDRLQQVLDWGVDAVISDEIDLLSRVSRERAAAPQRLTTND